MPSDVPNTGITSNQNPIFSWTVRGLMEQRGDSGCRLLSESQTEEVYQNVSHATRKADDILSQIYAQAAQDIHVAALKTIHGNGKDTPNEPTQQAPRSQHAADNISVFNLWYELHENFELPDLTDLIDALPAHRRANVEFAVAEAAREHLPRLERLPPRRAGANAPPHAGPIQPVTGTRPMPEQNAVPGCVTFIDDLIYRMRGSESTKCKTCGSQQYQAADIEVQIYAEERNLQRDDPEAVDMAMIEFLNHRDTPEWVNRDTVIRKTDKLVEFRGPLACIHQGMITAKSTVNRIGFFVFADDKPFDPTRSQAVRNHSPAGFAWGYGGSGPAQLALALLLEAGASEQEALRWHQDFKWNYIASNDSEAPLEIAGAAITGYISLRRSAA